jgi:4-nitrophenyl phosphatase/NagD protein
MDPMFEKIQSAKCFLFDMDGTIYLGDRLLPGVTDIVAYLDGLDLPYFFLTNNSSLSREDYVTKLEALGLLMPPEKIITSGEATAIYLSKQTPGAKIYLVGTPSLKKEFEGFGFELTDSDPELVVLGFDTTLTYEKLVVLCNYVRAGLVYIATHPDINCPVEGGLLPDIGAVMALVEASTGRKADLVIGKPHSPIVEAIVEKTGFSADEIAIVGDRLYTDIALGITGMGTVLVLSGETKQEDIPSASHQPDLVVNDMKQLLEIFREIEIE